MARQAKHRIKTVGKPRYLFAKVGGDNSFGNVEDVSSEDAKWLFAERLRGPQDAPLEREKQGLTARVLMDLFAPPPPNTHLPKNFRPFSAIECTHVPLDPLTEADLVTEAEVRAIFAAAGVSRGRWRGSASPRYAAPTAMSAASPTCCDATTPRGRGPTIWPPAVWPTC